jgi:hypothetical protein
MCTCAAHPTTNQTQVSVRAWVVKSNRAVAPLPVVAAGVLPVWGLSCVFCLVYMCMCEIEMRRKSIGSIYIHIHTHTYTYYLYTCLGKAQVVLDQHRLLAPVPVPLPSRAQQLGPLVHDQLEFISRDALQRLFIGTRLNGPLEGRGGRAGDGAPLLGFICVYVYKRSVDILYIRIYIHIYVHIYIHAPGVDRAGSPTPWTA